MSTEWLTGSSRERCENGKGKKIRVSETSKRKAPKWVKMARTTKKNLEPTKQLEARDDRRIVS